MIYISCGVIFFFIEYISNQQTVYIRIPIIVIKKLLLVGKEFLLKIIKMRIMTFKTPSSQDDIKFFSFINFLLYLSITSIIIDCFLSQQACSATIGVLLYNHHFTHYGRNRSRIIKNSIHIFRIIYVC